MRLLPSLEGSGEISTTIPYRGKASYFNTVIQFMKTRWIRLFRLARKDDFSSIGQMGRSARGREKPSPLETRHLGPGTFSKNRASRAMERAVPMPFSRAERLCHSFAQSRRTAMLTARGTWRG